MNLSPATSSSGKLVFGEGTANDAPTWCGPMRLLVIHVGFRLLASIKSHTCEASALKSIKVDQYHINPEAL